MNDVLSAIQKVRIDSTAFDKIKSYFFKTCVVLVQHFQASRAFVSIRIVRGRTD